MPHARGERIPPGTNKEKALLSWVARLAELSEQQAAEALKDWKHSAAATEPVEIAVLRRLTNSQYDNTVRDLIKDFSRPATRFPTEDYINGYKNQYEVMSISPVLAEAYSNGGKEWPRAPFGGAIREDCIPAKPVTPVRNVESALSRNLSGLHFAARSTRVTQRTSNAYQRVFFSQDGGLAGPQAVIEAMLQSPSFLFWLDKAPREEWDPYASASRLSHFLWNTTPDNRLLSAARNGELDTREGLERVVRATIEDPRAIEGVDEFVSQWLRFDRVLSASRERRTFRLFNARLAEAMRTLPGGQEAPHLPFPPSSIAPQRRRMRASKNG